MKTSAYDVVVLGGGIIGASLAETLARRGRSVALIERGGIGSESSSAAAGILSSQMDVPEPGPFFELCQASRRAYPRWVSRLERASGLSTGYLKRGVLYVALSAGEEARMDRRLRWQARLGLRAERLSPRRVRRLNPALDGKIKRGYFFPSEAQVDPAGLMRALDAACRKAGVRIFDQTTVERLRVARGAVRGVDTTRQGLGAQCVVNCLGSWAALGGAPPFRIPVAPVRGQMLAFDAPKELFRFPVVSERAYALQRQGGRVLIGSTIEAAGFNKSLTIRGMHAILCGMRHVSSAVDCLEFREAWAGLRPGTPDGFPVIGDTPVRGLFVASGHFRHGILLAPITAQLITQLIVTGRTALDISAFHPSRFRRTSKSLDT